MAVLDLQRGKAATGGPSAALDNIVTGVEAVPCIPHPGLIIPSKSPCIAGGLNMVFPEKGLEVQL